MSESKTPETEQEYQRLGARHGRVRVNFARQLETELAKAQADLGEALDFAESLLRGRLPTNAAEILKKHGRIK